MTNYLTTAQAATRLGLSESRVKHLCQQGRLGRKIGRNWAITPYEVRAFAAVPRPVGNPNFSRKKKPDGSL